MDMLIDPQILVASGAVFRKHEKGQVIIHEGCTSLYYFQIISGSVSFVNVRENGHNFLQGIYREGQSFGTPAMFLDVPIPASAIACSDVVLIRLGRNALLRMLKDHPDALLDVTLALCRNLYQKAFIGKSIARQGPEERINTLLQVLKRESGCDMAQKYKLTLSRQQIADMIGLRVETVIRAIKKLEEKGSLSIVRGKVFY